MYTLGEVIQWREVAYRIVGVNADGQKWHYVLENLETKKAWKVAGMTVEKFKLVEENQ